MRICEVSDWKNKHWFTNSKEYADAFRDIHKQYPMLDKVFRSYKTNDSRVNVTELPSYDQMIVDPTYFIEQKGRGGRIQLMSPAEYIRRADVGVTIKYDRPGPSEDRRQDVDNQIKRTNRRKQEREEKWKEYIQGADKPEWNADEDYKGDWHYEKFKYLMGKTTKEENPIDYRHLKHFHKRETTYKLNDKFPVLVLDQIQHQQEGYHRAIIAEKLGIEQVPVFVCVKVHPS